MSSDILVLGYGNPGRGDDALGPLLIDKLDRGKQKKHETRICFQLQPEQIFDLENYRQILFADASLSAPSPFSFTELAANCEFSFSTHTMSPETVLYLYETLLQRSPPPCFLLSIRGKQFTLGKEPSATAEKHLDAAYSFVSELLEKPALAHWRQKITPAPLSRPSGSPQESFR